MSARASAHFPNVLLPGCLHRVGRATTDSSRLRVSAHEYSGHTAVAGIVDNQSSRYQSATEAARASLVTAALSDCDPSIVLSPGHGPNCSTACRPWFRCRHAGRALAACAVSAAAAGCSGRAPGAGGRRRESPSCLCHSSGQPASQLPADGAEVRRHTLPSLSVLHCMPADVPCVSDTSFSCAKAAVPASATIPPASPAGSASPARPPSVGTTPQAPAHSPSILRARKTPKLACAPPSGGFPRPHRQHCALCDSRPNTLPCRARTTN